MKAIILNGCTRGLGRAILDLLVADHGNDVYALVRNPQGLGSSPLKAVCDCDYADPEQVRRNVASFFNAIDFTQYTDVYFINNLAVIQPVGLIGTLNEDELVAGCNVNITSNLLVVNAFVRSVMGKSCHAHLLNISSGVGAKALPGLAVYGISKLYLDYVTRALRAEMEARQQWFQATSFYPGGMKTDMQDTLRDLLVRSLSEFKIDTQRVTQQKLDEPATVAQVIVNHFINQADGWTTETAYFRDFLQEAPVDRNLPLLVVGATGGGVSEGILKALRMVGYQNILLLEHSADAVHMYRVPQKFVLKETPDDAGYAPRVLELCLAHGVRAILPGSTWEALAFAKSRELFNAQGIAVLVNNQRLISICNNKWDCYQFMAEQGIQTPRTIQGNSPVTELPFAFPVIVKPVVGRGSRNVFRVESLDELNGVLFYLSQKKVPLIVQEYIGTDDTEYTVGVVSNSAGAVVDSIVMHRHLGAGYTDRARVCAPSAINEFCEEVARKFQSTGPMNVQLRVGKDGQPYIFEINPRFSGSVPMRALAGFNEPDMLIRHCVFGETLARNTINYNLDFFRAFQELSVDRRHPEAGATFVSYL